MSVTSDRNSTGKGSCHLCSTSGVQPVGSKDKMGVTAVCFRLVMLEFILLENTVEKSYTRESGAVRLHVTPNRQQHFEYDPIYFHCDSNDESTQLKATRNTVEFVPSCNFKRTTSGSTCSIDKMYPGDSGEYWCETKEGERSNTVNITVTGGPVIVESPALPVFEGETVILRCNRKTKSNNLVFFYKDDVAVQIGPEEMRIKNVSKSTEGLYRCNISDVGTSPGSWLNVRGNSVTSVHKDLLSDDSKSFSVLILLRIAVTIFITLLLLLGLSKLKISACW
ncbi:low affinity immunoglobulin gamma Fc region receptor II-a-like [Anabas testudineus]|uniref:low affinity immunoglobulin gamma Fc region receptor II-a-like n=1 Tax=Anabas testudineus TaxID=64144 RepID=UPI000E45B62C|nr:low affinity immunoglobulin gamma Fc region receptor II-a-like [Anabas testudineus]